MESLPSVDPVPSPDELIVEALRPRLRKRRVTLLGDIPGTVETLRAVRALASAALDAGSPVVVAVEVPMTEQARIDAGDLEGLLEGSFWRRPSAYDDGRSSPAMAELLVDLVRRGVTVVAADGPWVGPGGSIDLASLPEVEADRDEGMARRILAAPSDAVTLVVLGVEHIRVRPGPDGRVPAGAIIARWEPGLVSLAPVWCGGVRHGLAGVGHDAGPIELPADGDATPGAWWATEVGADGFHGTWCVGPSSPSSRAG